MVANLHDNWALVNGKTGERVIYIPEESYKAILFAMGSHDRLYSDRAPLNETMLTRRTNYLLKRAGVYKRGMGDHAFRHSYQAEYLHNGGPEVLMHRIMGHTKAGDKTQLYLHADEEVMKAAMRYAPRRFLALELELIPREAVPA